MGWKIYFVLVVLLSAFGWFDTVLHPADYAAVVWARIPLDVLSLAGLYGFAFRRELLSAGVWRTVALGTLVLTPLLVGAGVARTAAHLSTAMIAAAIHLAIITPMVIALMLYARRLGAQPGDQVVAA